MDHIAYEFETATLRVEFVKGGLYEYQGVPLDTYEGSMGAGSKGQYFNQFIKKGGYPFASYNYY
jgi:hypothetical protein